MNQSHPKAFYLLNFISMWEYFSYYGMRILLVLYLIEGLFLSEQTALLVYAIYTALAEAGGVLGGFIADKFLGLKKTAQIGGWFIFTGHLLLFVESSSLVFYAGLGFIVLGTSSFRSNIAALVGSCYDENDPRREAAYTLYYSGINIGGLLATLSCSTVAAFYGWHAGFGVAAIGMFAANMALFFLPSNLENKNKEAAPPFFASLRKLALDFQMAKSIGFCFAVLILFYAAEEQIGSTLMLFLEKHGETHGVFENIPITSLSSLNPLTVIVLGPILSCFFKRSPLQEMRKLAIGFILLASAFLALRFTYEIGLGDIWIYTAAFSIALIALGELFVGPTIYSMISKMAPVHLKGVSMGLLTIAFGIANLLSGALSLSMSTNEADASIMLYSTGFGWIGMFALIAGGLLFFASGWGNELKDRKSKAAS